MGNAETTTYDANLASYAPNLEAEISTYEERLRVQYKRRQNALVACACAGILSIVCALALQQIGPAGHARSPERPAQMMYAAPGPSLIPPAIPTVKAPAPAATPRTEPLPTREAKPAPKRPSRRAADYDPYADPAPPKPKKAKPRRVAHDDPYG